MIWDFMNPHKISANSENKQKSYGILLLELVTWGVTNQDVLLLATIRYIKNQSYQNMTIIKVALLFLYSKGGKKLGRIRSIFDIEK